MRVAVTGASGLIGRTLVSALHDRGDTTVTFVRPSTSTSAGEVVRWDPEKSVVDENDLRRAGGFDAVVHLAGAGIGDHRWNPTRKNNLVSSRVSSTRLLVEALGQLRQGVELLASASAIGWYGSRGEEQLNEASSSGRGFLANLCQQWEDAARASTTHGVRVATLRTGVVLSSRGGALKKQLPLFHLALGGRLGPGTQWMSTVSLLDEVRAILWVLDHTLDGPVNLVGPAPLTNAEFTEALALVLGRPGKVSVPVVALHAALGREMAEELVLASQRVMPHTLQSTGFVFRHRDALAALRWAITSKF